MADEAEISLFRRVTAFGFVPFLSVVSPLVVLPVVASATDAAGWASIAIGQSVGGFASIVVAFGWAMVGPVEIARQPAEVSAIFFESLVTRTTILVAAVLPMALLCLATAPADHVLLAFVVAVSAAAGGLSSGWVGVGLGRARGVLLLEVVPRALLLVLAAILIGTGGSLYWYPIAILASSVLGVVLFAAFAVPLSVPSSSVMGLLRARLRGQLSAALTTLAAGAYSAAALLLVGVATSVQQTAVMSSADRLYRIGLFSVTALNSGLQAWVVHPDPAVAAGRRRRALRIHVAFGVLGALAYAGLAPTVAGLLFGDDLAPGYLVALGYGAAFGFLAPGTSLNQHFLVPASRVSEIFRTAVLGAVVGVPALLVLAHEWGAAGGAAGLALSELVVLGRLAWLVRHPPVDRADALPAEVPLDPT